MPPPPQKRQHETDSEGEEDEKGLPNPTTAKSRRQTFLRGYSETWNCLVPSSKGASFVWCSVCKTDFSCAHGGRNDCKKHIASKMHTSLMEMMKGTPSIKNAFRQQTSKAEGDLVHPVTNAETIMCQLIADANLSLSMADRLIPIMKAMFPDSKIAQGMQCSRPKATAMIKEMSAIAMKDIAQKMINQPFSLATDGSNEGEKKQFPLVIRTFDKDADGKLGLVTTQLLALRNCDGSATGKNIFELLNTELTAQRISWKNCVAFGSDNASVMTGQHKGVISFVSKENSNVYLAACTLHLVHIGAKKGAACLPPIEEKLVDIYYFFMKSTVRQSNLREFQKLYDVDQRKMLKHGCTRWLSIARCIKRLLETWDPLKHLFYEEYQKKEEKEKKSRGSSKKSAKSDGKEDQTTEATVATEATEKKSRGSSKKSAKSDRKEDQTTEATEATEDTEVEEQIAGASAKKIEALYDFLRSKTNKLYTMFLSYTLQVYDGVLVKLQAEEPLIHELHDALQNLVLSLFSRFLKPEAVEGKQVTDVEFQERKNQKDDEDILVGDAARDQLDDPDKNYLRPEKIKQFYESVRRYFEVTCLYLLKKLPLSDPLLQHAVVVDPSKKRRTSQKDLRFFTKKFPVLLPAGVKGETILEQFTKYQMTDITDCIGDRVDETWVAISQQHPDLKDLCEVMLGICTIPHSSAACERVFSCVRKTATEQRTSMSPETIEALLVLKSREQRVYTTEELGQLKSAYFNAQHKQK